LELLFADEELRRTVLARIEEPDYEDLPTASVFRALVEIEREGGTFDFATLSAKTEGDTVAADLVPLLLMSETTRAEGEALDDALAVAESCLSTLRVMAVDRRINELSMEIAAAERAGDESRRDRLALEHLELARKRNMFLPHTEAATNF
ncbi:MAG TPA: hypothetical protein VK619_19705, partial [Pyrinomonadaceae bacterium]|nr:hypothetical protein [Pyrinomonadaceae bacterium]